MFRPKFIALVALTIICLLGCGGSSSSDQDSNLALSLTTLSSNCYNAKLDRECNSIPLRNAAVFLRKLYSTDIEELQTDETGTIRLSLDPGDYEIALGRRYSYTDFMELFGESACTFDDTLDVCSAGGNSCYAVRAPNYSPYPPNYNSSDDPGHDEFLQRREAFGPLVIEETRSEYKLEYGLRCI